MKKVWHKFLGDIVLIAGVSTGLAFPLVFAIVYFSNLSVSQVEYLKLVLIGPLMTVSLFDWILWPSKEERDKCQH